LFTVIDEEAIRYYLELEQSARPRRHLRGRSPDDEREQWYFEVLEDEGELIAVRQLTIEADGTRHRYSPQHLEDGWGFLTDQPIDPTDELSPCTADEFNAAWSTD
jgi:hypothetical protein